MCKLLMLISLTALFSFVVIDNELTKKEREDAVSYFKETQQALETEMKGLSENQLNWKPADSVWSVAECVEHIAISEKVLFDLTMNSLKEAANPEKRKDLKMDDVAVKKIVTDRSFRVKTREAFVPSGQFGNARKALEVFNERRDALIQYIKETKDDLRNHFVETPLGVVDAYQFLLFLSGHTKRHTLQIAELKSNPGFPKN